MSKTSQPVKSTITSTRKWIFRVILVLLPVIFLFLIELVLGIINFGEDLRLFIPYHENEQLLVGNVDVSLRYFSKKDMTGFGTVDSFWQKKQPKTKRIFVLGGSTTAGYPYFFNGGFPAMLKDRLITAYPDYEFEVINLGMTAINSYTIRDLARECLDYNPDLFLIYAGHNEFYGALGTGSNQGSFFQSLGGRKAILAYIKIKQLRTYRLIQKLVNSIRSTQSSGKSGGTETLMSKLAKEQEISHLSPLYQRTLDDFAVNIRDIIRWSQVRDIPVLIGTVVSNLRDQRPFVSIGDPSVSRDKLEKKIAQVKDLMMKGQFGAALTQLEKLIDRNPTYALLHFFAGRCSEFLGNYDQAKTHYRQARDYDGLRFRASGDLNILIKSFQEESSVYVSDVERLMETESTNELIGKNFILEHLHPTVEGNFLIAKSFANTLIEQDILGIGEALVKSDEFFRDQIRVTPMDFSMANYRIRILTSGWPFRIHNRFVKVTDLKPQTPVDSAAVDLLKNKKSFWEAHIWIAEHYIASGETDEAIMEYEALVKAFPNVWKSYKVLANLQIDLGIMDEALENLLKAVVLGGDAYCHKMAGSILVQQKKPDEGLPYLKRAVALSPNDKQARFNLSGAYYMQGDVEAAKQELEYIIRMFPDYNMAQDFYDRILQAESGGDH